MASTYYKDYKPYSLDTTKLNDLNVESDIY